MEKKRIKDILLSNLCIYIIEIYRKNNYIYKFKINFIKNNIKSSILVTKNNYIYNDILLENKNIIYYEGQNNNKDDKYIKKNSILLYRKNNIDNFKFGGIVINIKLVRKYIKNIQTALYELEINRNIKINNIVVGTEFVKNSKFSGPGCLKKSALYKLGYLILGNNQSGINCIKRIENN